MPYFDRWDIIRAHYLYAIEYHGGQFSELYKRQCKISEYYKTFGFSYHGLSDNAKAIYDSLVERKYLQ